MWPQWFWSTSNSCFHVNKEVRSSQTLYISFLSLDLIFSVCLIKCFHTFSVIETLCIGTVFWNICIKILFETMLPWKIFWSWMWSWQVFWLMNMAMEKFCLRTAGLDTPFCIKHEDYTHFCYKIVPQATTVDRSLLENTVCIYILQFL